MTNLDHGKFTRTTTLFHSLLALDVFFLFFTGYSAMFNDELWWLLALFGGAQGVLAVHRIAGLVLIALTVFWVVMLVIGPGRQGNLREALPDFQADTAAFKQDLAFVFGQAEERHPNARQFAGHSADDVPLLSYIGKGVVWIFTVELVLLMVSGLLIWSKTGLMDVMATKAAAIAFVAFHGILGVIMLMGVMFHIFEHGFHPAFYPVELKAFIPKRDIPHSESEPAADESVTGIERLTLRPSWTWASSLAGVATVIGIVSVLVASIVDSGYPIPSELTVGGGATSLLLTVGVNVGILVLFVGLLLSVYGNVLRARYEAQRHGQTEPTAGHDTTDD